MLSSPLLFAVMGLARNEYDLQLHAVLLRAMRASGGDRPQLESELGEVERQLADLPEDPRRPMLALSRRMRWSADEIAFIWTSVALVANPRLLLHARSLDDTAPRGLSPSLFVRLAGLDPARARALGLALLDHGGARHGLLIASRGDQVAAAVCWRAAAPLVRLLAGEPVGEGLLVRLAVPADVVHDETQRHALAQIQAILARSEPVVLHIEGAELSGRRTAATIAASRPVIALDLAQLVRGPEALVDALTALRREAALQGAVPLIAGVEELAGGDGLRVVAQQLELVDGPVALVTTWHGLDVGGRLPSVRVEWPIPDVATRVALWQNLARLEEPAVSRELAQRFRLGAGAIRRAIASAQILAGGERESPAHVIEGIRQNIADRMGGLAERVVVKQSWSDLVLAEDVLAQVKGLVARVRHAHLVYEEWGFRTKMPRGVGVAALFSGVPGTGKTMVAGLIASDLELELYQVDLSKVVSKWVGETEKQLARVFEAAEAGHALLLFDEADALFGQRSSETRGATDRYANLEVNFLLQRIESFNGIVILTTNLEASIDKALKRRLASHVVFQHPDDDERTRLWQRLLIDADGPMHADIDPHALSVQFPKMTGANIRNAALGAAFLAAAERRPYIDHATAVQAARSEYLSMGNVLATPPGL